MGDIQPKEYYNEIYNELKATDYKQSDYYELWKIILKVIKPHRDDSILELGCGAGQFAQMIYDNGYRKYLGIDFSDKAIEIASKGDMKFKLYDVLKVDQLTYKYDVIIALEFFEHIYDLKVISLLRQKTPIIFTLPDFGDPAHERWFKTEEGVRDYYEGFIDFKTIEKYWKYFICNGVIK